MITPTIHTDDQLLHRWLSNLKPIPERGEARHRWAAVRDTFAIGATSAKQVCQRHGFDPDEWVRK